MKKQGGKEEWKWSDYEELVGNVCRDIARGDLSLLPDHLREELHGSGGIRYYGACEVSGKSGHRHQFDAMMSLTCLGTRIVIVIECKYYKDRVGIEDVLEFSARLEDVAAHKGIMVTPKGYTDGALKTAESKGIALVIFNSRGYSAVRAFGGMAGGVTLDGSYVSAPGQEAYDNFWPYVVERHLRDLLATHR